MRLKTIEEVEEADTQELQAHKRRSDFLTKNRDRELVQKEEERWSSVPQIFRHFFWKTLTDLSINLPSSSKDKDADTDMGGVLRGPSCDYNLPTTNPIEKIERDGPWARQHICRPYESKDFRRMAIVTFMKPNRMRATSAFSVSNIGNLNMKSPEKNRDKHRNKNAGLRRNKAIKGQRRLNSRSTSTDEWALMLRCSRRLMRTRTVSLRRRRNERQAGEKQQERHTLGKINGG